MKPNTYLGLYAIAFIGLIVFLYMPSEYKVVKQGECYSYTVGTYTADYCFATIEEAENKILEMKEYERERETHDNLDWEEVNTEEDNNE